MTQQQRKQYTAEFKREAVGLVTEQGYTIVEAARNLGIRGSMLSRWQREHLRKQQQAFSRYRGHQPVEVEELKRLREENRRLKMEREILKKQRPSSRRSPGKICVRLLPPSSVPGMDMLPCTGG